MCHYPKRCKAAGDFAPECPKEIEPKPICYVSNKCEGCPYPGHGFICWSADGTCLRTAMLKKIKEDSL